MFEKLEYVFHESGGICQVADICAAPLENMPAERQYYVLQPLNDANSVIYAPVDSNCIFIRRLMTQNEAVALLEKISEVTVIDEKNPKQLRNKYIEALRTHDPIEWVRIIKTANERLALLAMRSQRMSETERSFLERAKKYLYGELSLALNLCEQDMEQYLSKYFT